MDNKIYSIIEEQIGYKFENKMLLQQAFIRRSYTQEHSEWQNNEVLEFIGDKILDMAVVKFLARFYGLTTDKCEYGSKLAEGKLTEIKKRLVEKKMLARRIDMMSLQNYLIMGKGDQLNNVENDISVKEDLFEAILGAIAMDSGWDWKALENSIEQMLDIEYYLKNGFENENNYVELIQQWCQKKEGELPKYTFHEMRMPSDSIRPFHRDNWKQPYIACYTCKVLLPNMFSVFEGGGITKSEARMLAAQKAYEYLKTKNMLFSIEDEIGEPTLEKAINQLQELAQKGHITMPQYNFKQEYDCNGNPVWTCVCSVDGYEDSYINTCSSKKEAKRESAYEMLRCVLGYEDNSDGYYYDDEDEDDDYWG